MQSTAAKFLGRNLPLASRLCLYGSQQRLAYSCLGNQHGLKTCTWNQPNSATNLENDSPSPCHHANSSSLPYLCRHGNSMVPFRCYGNSLSSSSCNNVHLTNHACLINSKILLGHLRLYTSWTRSGAFLKVSNVPAMFARDESTDDKRSTPGFSLGLKSTALYLSSLLILMLGMAYAGVPLYKMFCQVGTWARFIY
jgi:hypothetical protein